MIIRDLFNKDIERTIEGVVTIGRNSFEHLDSLVTIVIPSSVTTIGNGAFTGCTGLISITINRDTPPTMDYSFNDTNNCPIYVPAGSVSAYKSASVWSEYASRIQAIQ